MDNLNYNRVGTRDVEKLERKACGPRETLGSPVSQAVTVARNTLLNFYFQFVDNLTTISLS